VIRPSLAKAYTDRLPIYRTLARRVRNKLIAHLRNAGIPAAATYRAKDVHSFVKKAIDPSKTYVNPLKEIHDKAGVRVVAGYMEDFREVQRLIPIWFPGAVEDDKTQRTPDSFGYLGVHFDVALPLEELKTDTKLKGEVCEVQLHSRASNLWSESEHDLTYKAVQPPPPQVQRRMNRLVALTELFDTELSGCREDLRSLPGYDNAALLMRLERQFFRFTASAYRRSLSLTVIEALRTAYPGQSGEQVANVVDNFVATKASDLKATLARRDVDPQMDVMLSQPESLLVFERISANRINTLRKAWSGVLPLEYLQHLAELWGSAV